MGIQLPSNPFTQRGVIRDPSQFFGRQTKLNQIFDRLKMMQSISVVGERSTGKSSLLYHIFQMGRQRLGAGVHLIYTDLPDVTDEASFYGCVCRELDTKGNSFNDLEKAVRDRKVVACLDEFDRVTEQPSFSQGFFSSLRSLAQSGNLALIVATQHSLADLCRTEQIAAGPFWNIFARVDLGPFTPEEAKEFIHTRFSAAGVSVSAKEVARVLQLAGRFPFFLQLACYHLFEVKIGRAIRWEQTFEQEAYDHLTYLPRRKQQRLWTWFITILRELFHPPDYQDKNP